MKSSNVKLMTKMGILYFISLGLISCASIRGPEKTAQLVAEEIGDVNDRNSQGKTLLLRAVEAGYIDLVKKLLDRGADVNLADKLGTTPLMAAILVDDDYLTQLVLNKRPDLNAKNNAGWTALMMASWEPGDWSRSALVARGADLEARDNSGQTAYSKAIQRGFLKHAQALVDRGAKALAVKTNPSPCPCPPMTKAQRWALACGAILRQANGDSHCRLASCGPQDKVFHQDFLANSWGIRSRQEALEELNELKTKGHQAKYFGMVSYLHQVPLGVIDEFLLRFKDDPDTLKKIQFVRGKGASLGQRGILAWDLGRYVFVAASAVTCGYLSEKEAWDLILPVAKQIQAKYRSWEDFSENYMVGREFWDADDDRMKGMRSIQRSFLDPKNTESPWKQSDWDTDLNSEAMTATLGPSSDVFPVIPSVPLVELQKQANAGVAWAQYALGVIYFEDQRVDKDKTVSLRFMKTAAEGGYPWAQYWMAEVYEEGDGAPKDPVKSFKWRRAAALQGHPDAQTAVGKAYRIGDGVEKNAKASAQWFDRAASQGDSEARAWLGWCYQHGMGVSKNASAAISHFGQAFEGGNLWACTQLGHFFDDGKLVPQDLEKAKRYYELAAKKGDAEGQCMLGHLYYMGRGVPQDYALARQWYEKAVAQGWLDAKPILGWLLAYGKGGEKDVKRGVALSREAAVVGSTNGQANLAIMLLEGALGNPDPVEALQWNTAAALAGDQRSQSSLAWQYLEGTGTTRDPVKAQEWFLKAAASGNLWAYSGIRHAMLRGMLPMRPEAADWVEMQAKASDPDLAASTAENFRLGLFVPKDPRRARQLLARASDTGNVFAQAQLAEMLDLGEGGAADPAGARALYSKFVKAEGTYKFDGKPAPITLVRGPLPVDPGSKVFVSAPGLTLDCSDDEKVVYSPCTDKTSLSAEIRMLMDEKWLYLWAHVQQGGPPVNRQKDRFIWDGDGLEFWLSSRSDLTTRSRNMRTRWDYAIHLAPTSADGQAHAYFSDERFKGMPVASKILKDGYIVVGAVPLDWLDKMPRKKGAQLRFDVDVQQAGPDGHRMRKYFWNAKNDDVSNPDGWGVVELR